MAHSGRDGPLSAPNPRWGGPTAAVWTRPGSGKVIHPGTDLTSIRKAARRCKRFHRTWLCLAISVCASIRADRAPTGLDLSLMSSKDEAFPYVHRDTCVGVPPGRDSWTSRTMPRMGEFLGGGIQLFAPPCGHRTPSHSPRRGSLAWRGRSRTKMRIADHVARGAESAKQIGDRGVDLILPENDARELDRSMRDGRCECRICGSDVQYESVWRPS